jgi:FtsH-binding integral membrane protein
MRLTRKDGAAALAVAVAAGLYAGFLAEASPSLVSGPRALAGAVFALGVLGCALGGTSTMQADRVPSRLWMPVFGMLGTATLVAGLFAMTTGNPSALAILVWGTVALWVVATVRRVLAGHYAKVRDTDLHRLIEAERRNRPVRTASGGGRVT